MFGKTKNYDAQMKPLVDAVTAYIGDLVDDEATEENEASFTRDIEWILDTLDHPGDPFFESVRKGAIRETFQTPIDEPILIRSVRVNKY